MTRKPINWAPQNPRSNVGKDYNWDVEHPQKSTFEQRQALLQEVLKDPSARCLRRSRQVQSIEFDLLSLLSNIFMPPEFFWFKYTSHKHQQEWSEFLAKRPRVAAHFSDNKLKAFSLVVKDQPWTEIKICEQCNKAQGISNFHKKKGGLWGVDNWCQDCVSLKKRKSSNKAKARKTTKIILKNVKFVDQGVEEFLRNGLERLAELLANNEIIDKQIKRK